MSQIVPLTSAPNQSIRVTLNVNGASVTLNLRVYFNAAGGFWVMDIADQIGKALVSSVPLITGAWPAANILAPFDYLKIGSAFVINVGSASEWPNTTNLGSGFRLLWDNN
jgi:hypothetical protein